MFHITNRQYDIAKWTIQVGFPGFTAFYISIAQIWDLANTDKVVGTLAAVTIFAGLFIGISSKQYKGEVEELFANEDLPPSTA